VGSLPLSFLPSSSSLNSFVVLEYTQKKLLTLLSVDVEILLNFVTSFLQTNFHASKK
jgi:hypothetical protein